MNLKNEYLNLWHDKRNQGSQPVYRNNARAVFEHRGVVVYKIHDRLFDYVFAGAAITQRAGFKAENAPEIIDSILEGRCMLTCDAVRAHVAAHVPALIA